MVPAEWTTSNSKPLQQPRFICQHIVNVHLSELNHTVPDTALFDYRSHWNPLWVEISTKKLFFHLLDVTVLNSSILLHSCGAKYIAHRDFRLLLVRNLIEEAGKSQDRPTPRLVGRKYCATREHPKPTLASEITHQTSLLSTFNSRPQQRHSAQERQV